MAGRHTILPCSRRKFLAGWENAKPGISVIENFDMTVQKNSRLSEAKSLEFRGEAFNAFNHAQFYGPVSVDGQREDPSFGQIESAAAARLMQLAAKFNF
jgi:hypothetical protein